MLKQEDIKSIRKNLELSQSKLAELSGVSKYDISGFELGKLFASREDLSAINSVFDRILKGDLTVSKKKRICRQEFSSHILSDRPRRHYSVTVNNSSYLELLKTISEKFAAIPVDAPKVMSFFAGCGGLCYGLKAAGFDIVAANELVPEYYAIHKANFPESETLSADIRDISNEELSKVIEKHGDIDLFAGGPPCQGFSLAGKRDVNDSRNTLFSYYLRLADFCRPKVILMENVSLLLTMKNAEGGLVKDDIVRLFRQIGYQSSFFVVNASDYGVPQDRNRVFFVGVRNDIKIAPSFPNPEYVKATGGLFDDGPLKFTFGDAVSDLEFIESGERASNDCLHRATTHPEHVIRWLVDVPQGKSAHDNDNPALRPTSGFNTTYKRQVWDEPGRTVTTNFNMISGSNNVHPIATRALTIREAMRLQSFPDSFVMTGKDGDIQKVIGNAVPPVLAYKIGRFLLETYFGSNS